MPAPTIRYPSGASTSIPHHPRPRTERAPMPYSDLDPSKFSLSKIVATIGPATDVEETLRRVIENGASVLRVNFSHGSFEEHAERVRTVRRVSDALGKPVAILGDLCGPKIRVGLVKAPGIQLTAGQDFSLRTDIDESKDGETPELPCTYEPLAAEVHEGHRVLINDGAIRALATGSDGSTLRCRVVVGGLVTTGKGVNLPDSDISAPAITEHDRACVRFGIDHKFDYFALSFVRRGEEVRELRSIIEGHCAEADCGGSLDATRTDPTIPIISKIEKPQAVERIDEILEESDAIMVARGDLGVEMDLARVPIIQKILIQRAHDYGKPCIVATQMLETMIEKPFPTRAESSDVAGAIFDGTDAVMLSGETAIGKYAPLAVQMMRRIALATEERLRELPQSSRPSEVVRESRYRTAALAHGAWHMVQDVDAKLVCVWSQHGGSARYLSRIGLRVPIIAFSSSEAAVRRMTLLYGVTPVLMRTLPEHRSEFAKMVDEFVLTRGMAEVGGMMVLLAGKPFGVPGVVNTVSIRRVGEFAATGG
ncbi:MAG: pyruvate kinase [Phycisphaeraceae bacterium]|nr:MAG: pyruvate kinase [Phycisphaeraceae bacterium]